MIRTKSTKNIGKTVWIFQANELNSGNMLAKLEFTGFVGVSFFGWGRNGEISATLF